MNLQQAIDQLVDLLTRAEKALNGMLSMGATHEQLVLLRAACVVDIRSETGDVKNAMNAALQCHR